MKDWILNEPISDRLSVVLRKWSTDNYTTYVVHYYDKETGGYHSGFYGKLGEAIACFNERINLA